MARTTWTKGVPLGAALQERLRRLVHDVGEKEVAARLGVGVISIVRAAAGLGLRRGTAFVIESKLGDAEPVRIAS